MGTPTMPMVTGCTGILRLIATAILVPLFPWIGAPAGSVLPGRLALALRIGARMAFVHHSALRSLSALAMRAMRALRPCRAIVTMRPA
jgi:hypothetical protein